MSNQQSPGGFGGNYPPGQQGMGPMYPPQKKGMSTGAIIGIVAAVLVGVMLLIVVVFAVLGVYGTRKYISNAKTAEAKNSLGQIGKDAVAAYESESLDTQTLGIGESGGVIHHKVCPSSRPVPSSMESVSARKYQSSRGDWEDDAGWKCLRFEMTSPQYYQYTYASTSDSFTATAKGDLNGNSIPSKFELQGRVQSDQLRVAPSIMETDPEE